MDKLMTLFSIIIFILIIITYFAGIYKCGDFLDNIECINDSERTILFCLLIPFLPIFTVKGLFDIFIKIRGKND